MKNIKDLMSTMDLAFLVTVSAVFSYGLFYCFSYGYYQYYGLPMMFLELDVKDLTATALVVTILVIWLFLIVMPKDKTFSAKKVTRDLIVFMILFSIMFFVIDSKSSTEQLLFLAAIIVILSTVLVIINLKIYFYPLLILIILSLGVSFLFGQVKAQNLEEYLVISSEEKQPYVVLDTFDNQYVVASVDLGKKIIEPKFQVIEMKSEEDKKVELQRMHTGKLKVKKQ